MSAWVIRAGKYGEREAWALERGLAGGGFHEVGDLSSASSREAVGRVVSSAFPNASPGRTANYTGQLWALRSLVTIGDLVVMPMKTTQQIALGTCTVGYAYRADEPDPDRRHAVSVDWQVTDLPRTAVRGDLLNTLGGAMTIFQASRNDAETRLRTVVVELLDPGSGGTTTSASQGRRAQGMDEDQPVPVIDPPSPPTLLAIRDRVRAFIAENFTGHELTRLVAAVLRTRGYVCDVSPAGPDQGVDIIAGRGPLGLDSPTLIVEVKSEAGAIGSTVVRGLQGAMSQHRADQGLLVAWGGLNRQARNEIRTDRLTMRVWDADQLLDAMFESYEQLPDSLRAQIPLTRAWVLDEEL